MNSFIERRWKIILTVILLLAAVFRLQGVNWDDGHHLHPDERYMTLVANAIHFPQNIFQYFDTTSSPLNPYNNKFDTFIYGTAPLFLVRLLAELFNKTDYDQIVIVGRIMSAVSDLIVVFMICIIGTRLYGRKAGLLAAFLYASAVFPIQQSHFFTVDAFANVPLMFTFWFSLNITDSKRGWSSFVMAGVGLGVMAASRINLGLFAGIIVFAGLLRLAGFTIDENNSFGGEEALRPQTGSWSRKNNILIGLALTAITSLMVFRVIQPYDFTGFFSPNPQFVSDLNYVKQIISGEKDSPPGHQWANRTPYWFPWYNLVFWGMGPVLGGIAWMGVLAAVIKIFREEQWKHTIIVLWILGLFLYHGQQFVMTMRYFLPIYPFLSIVGAWFLLELLEKASSVVHGPNRFGVINKNTTVLLILIVLGATLGWAISFSAIYTKPHTRVTASEWLYANVSDSQIIGTEYWDDALPLQGVVPAIPRKNDILLDLYADDTPAKREHMIQWMDQVDYIVLSSNRLYDSIPRLPSRYPLTTQYYQWLFDGQLGFELVEEFTSYPQFLNVVIYDDNAEEAFSVYDHPKVTIFKKTAAYSHAATAALFNQVDLLEVPAISALASNIATTQYKIPPAELSDSRSSGGTWTDLFQSNSLSNRYPIITWVTLLWLIACLTFPFTFFLFRNFADRGFAFAKGLGILFLSWWAWTLGSYHILPFSRFSILLGFVIMVGGGLFISLRYTSEIRTYVQNNWKILLIEEVVFLTIFALGLFIRYQNPDLWHPSLGGEKPMDFAFLNAVTKTTYFPPYNPWFAGYFINYYYFGQLIAGTLVRLTGIVPEVAYNLLIPMFFSLSASGVFGIVVNFAIHRQQVSGHARDARKVNLISAVMFGVLGVILVLIIGNLGEVKMIAKALLELSGRNGIQGLIHGLLSWAFHGESLPLRPGDWYWTATRIIPNTINEFPFFTFLYADLHAHMIAIPYTLIALGIAMQLALTLFEIKLYDFILIGFVLGSLRAINTWDYPVYLGVIGATLILKPDANLDGDEEQKRQHWMQVVFTLFCQLAMVVFSVRVIGFSVSIEAMMFVLLLFLGVAVHVSKNGTLWTAPSSLIRFGWRYVVVVGTSMLLFFPFLQNFTTGNTLFGLWQGDTTTLSEYLTVQGVFIFIVATFLIVSVLAHNALIKVRRTNWVIYIIVAVVALGSFLIMPKLPVLALLLPFFCMGFWLALRPDVSMHYKWVSLLLLAGLGLTLLSEVGYLKGDFGRMNTVFKFYMQAWVIVGIASTFSIVLMAEQFTNTVLMDHKNKLLSTVRWIWIGVAALLVFCGLVYPVAATWGKSSDRYVKFMSPGLNGIRFMKQATYNENSHYLYLRDDYLAIQWMRKNIKGSPVIMEANAGLYRWGSRYSVYTGLPTVIGWDWHTKQQYSLLPDQVINHRVLLVNEFYNTTDRERAMQIANHYRVSYIIVGGVEKAIYDPIGLEKFELMAQANVLSKVYSVGDTTIYQIIPIGQQP